MANVLRTVFVVLVLFTGWIVGSVYPAPDSLIARLNPKALQERALAGLKSLDWAELQAALPKDKADAISTEAVTAATKEGRAIEIERVADLADMTPEIPRITVDPTAGFEPTLSACPGMTVSNAPALDAKRALVGFQPIVDINGVKLAANPTRGACLSSGFGPRNGRTHRGVDYHSANGGPIMAAADGIIIELKYRDDYGNMILIDHGKGVYSRYAHLSTFRQGLSVGSTVKAGEEIGLMGNTASYPVPIHLHFEVLQGDYTNPKGSFGLTPTNVFNPQGAK